MSGIDELSKTTSHELISDVRCPNWCNDGKVKIEASSIYAGWVGWRNCEFCEGRGNVSTEESEKIEELL